MKKASILIGLTLFCMAPVAAASPASGCRDATAEQTRAPARKVNEARKRTTSSPLGKGCVGCIVPLDGFSSSMAIRSLN